MKFENCIYDHLQLADRFLKCAEGLLFAAKKSKPKNKMLFIDLDRGVCYFGFDSFFGMALWKVKYRNIFGDDEAKFLYLLDDGGGFIASMLINPDFAIEIAAHYIGVAERLMKLEDKYEN